MTQVWRLARRRGAAGMALYTLVDDTRLRLRSRRGHPPLTVPLDLYLTANGHAHRRRLYVDDGPSGGPDWPATLWLPLAVAQQRVGWLVVWADMTAPLRRRSSLARLRTLADSLAHALRASQLQAELEWQRTQNDILQRQLLEAERRHVRPLSLANQIARQLTAPLNIDDIFQMTVKHLTVELGFTSASIFTYDKATHEVELRALCGPEGYDKPVGSRFAAKGNLSGLAIESGDVVVANNAMQDPRTAYLRPHQFQAVLSAPMRVGDAILGVLNVAHGVVNGFAAGDIAMLQALADQLAAAVSAARLYESEREQVRLLGLTNQLARLTTGSLDVDTVLTTATRALTEEMGFYQALVMLHDSRTNELVVRATSGPESHLVPAGLRLPVSQGLNGLAFRTGNVVYSDNSMEDERTFLLPGLTIHSVIVTPLRQGDAMLGTLHVARKKIQTFTASEVAVIQAVADQLGAAVAAAQLYEAERRKTRQLIAIHSILREVASILDTDEIIERVVTRIRDHLGYSTICLYLMREGALTPVAGDMNRPPERPGVGPVGMAASTGLGYLTKNPARMTVPMSLGERALGVLDVQAETPGAIDEVALVAMGAIASQVAVSLVNAENFKAATERAEELSALYAAAQAVVSQLGLTEVAQTVADEARRLTNADGAMVLRLTSDGSERVVLARSGDLIAMEGDPGVNNLLVVPLQAQGGMIGELRVSQGREGRGFGERDVRLLSIFAQQAALAIHNALLYQAERGLTRQLDLANRIARLTTAALDVDEVLQTTTQALTSDLGFFAATIMLYDPVTNELVIRAINSPEDDPTQLGYRFSPLKGVSGLAFRTGEIVISNEAESDPRILLITPDSAVRSVIAVPLRQGNDTLGVLHVAANAPNRFGPGEEAVLRAVADQLTAAITAARLYEAEQRKTGRLQAVHTINREIAGLLYKTEVVESVVRLAQDRFSFDHVSVYLIEEDMVRRVAGDRGEPMVRVGDRGVGQVAQTGRPRLIHTMRTHDDSMTDGFDSPGSDGATPAQFLVPISVGKRVYGVLAAESANPLAFDEADQLALGAVASQTAVALVNADNYADATQRAIALQTLYVATQAIMTELSPADVLQAVAERASELVGADRASVLLLSADGTERVIVAQSRTMPVSHVGNKIPVGEGITGQVALTGTPVLANDLQHNPHLLAGMRETGLTALISVPLQAKDYILGEILATSYQPDFKFTERDLRLLRVFAQPAALAINNAHLYATERQLVEQLGLANRIGRLTTAALDVEDVLSITVRSLTEDLGFSEAVILLHDSETGALVLQAGSGDIVRAIPLGTHLPTARGLVGLSFESGEIVIANDAARDPRVYRPTQAPLGSAVATPLRRGEDILGILYVGSETSYQFTPAKVAVIQAIADQLATAVTAARLYEETLGAKQRAETILNEAQAGLVVFDDAWRVVALNPAAESILQRVSAQVIGLSLVDLLGKDHADNLAQMASAGAVAARRMIDAQLSEQKRDVLMGSTRLQPGYLVSLLDVTALKEVDRLKSEIVANFSHELRAPLASIKAYTELLLHYTQTGSELPEQFLTIVNQETDRLTDLVNDVLDLSRLEAGRPEMEYAAIDMRPLVEDVVRVLHVQAQERGIKIEIQASRRLGAVWGDRQLLSLLVRNLAVNAIKYNRPGGYVGIMLDQIEDKVAAQVYVRLRVRDTGVGIPAAAIPHLFEKFFRVRSTTESGIQGTGLGLPLTKAAVEAHGGKISVTSQEGVGTEFTVLLPVAPTTASTRILDVRARPSQPHRKGKK